MRNMKVAKKLILSFSIVTLLVTILGVFSIIIIMHMKADHLGMYENQTKPMEEISSVIYYTQIVRIQTRDVALNAGNTENQKALESSLNDNYINLEKHMEAYEKMIKNVQIQEIFEEAKNQYTTVLKPGLIEIVNAALDDMTQEDILNMMGELKSTIEAISDNFTECIQLQMEDAKINVDNYTLTVRNMYILVWVILAVTVIAATALAFYLSGIISKPLMRMKSFFDKVRLTGDITFTEEEKKTVAEDMKFKDEIGQCVTSCANLIFRLLDVNEILGRVAAGDLTVDMEIISEKDSIGLAVEKMTESLNAMVGKIDATSKHVAAGAEQISEGTEQIARGAQGLSSGSNEQAASVQELVSSVNEINMQMTENTRRAQECTEDIIVTGEYIEKSMYSMNHMLEAMSAIDESSKSIANAIKVIDDIASQTNLLALNAAIEAARAGEAGKGFSVVADEVRKLAEMSAQAAKETAELIQDSLEQVSKGSEIVEQTNDGLRIVVDKSSNVKDLSMEMTRSLEQQVAAIGEINQAIEQVSNVIQTNAVTAQESAAAAEEAAAAAEDMSAQAAAFKDIMDGFKLK